VYARLEALEEAVAALQPPPPAPGALIGAATWTLADLHDLEARIGATVPVHRSFDSSSRWDVRTTRIADDIAKARQSVASWTTYPDAAALETIRATTPPGHRLSICCKHECDVPSKAVDPFAHAAQMAQVSVTVRSWDRPEITTRVTFTGWGGEAGSGQRVRAYLDAGIADVVDHVSIDPYNTYGYQGQTKWTHPIELVTPWLALADEYGFRGRMAIDEYSCPEHPAGPDWKVADLAQMVAIADSEGMGWFTYFDVEQGVISDGPDHRIKSSPEHLAKFAEYASR
jgi:hypothetical protein